MIPVLMMAAVLSSAGEGNGQPAKCACLRDEEKNTRLAWAGAEAGWNATTGVGALIGLNPVYAFGVDLGVGAGLTGPRVGARLRLQPFDSAVSPFFGAGLVYIPPQRGRRLVLGDGTVEVRHDRLFIPQLMVGATFRPDNSIFFGTVAAGWAFNDPFGSKIQVVNGRPQAEAGANSLVNGGLLLSLAAGVRFGAWGRPASPPPQDPQQGQEPSESGKVPDLDDNDKGEKIHARAPKQDLWPRGGNAEEHLLAVVGTTPGGNFVIVDSADPGGKPRVVTPEQLEGFMKGNAQAMAINGPASSQR
jgi:hypothetical protein